ncbi:hypothetical protein N0V93_005368 [Gnomoniopsis smithogilvyi]|uniref:Uncharacterized protein n=1 Tax=Gnomoniopsis smithogilvyi TaxID=1191159 RepID=A0A9W8YUL4_9PEZI|nr:hypothetical protein N0V93_005368 [Gnomoniopsis smithogilvyi]
MASRSDPGPSSQSPTRSMSPTVFSASDTSSEYKWNSFEIRTLICLIIKGAHYDSKGPVDPMDFADMLNKALNPVKATTERSKALFDRDIPVDDVQKMLRRILAKKSHAIDVVLRDPAVAITKRQVNAFMRQLDFDGGENEWLDEHRREKVMVERAEMRRQLEKRTEGRPMSQERWEHGQERLRDVQSPRAQRLLSNWGIGRTFFEGELFQHRGRWNQTDRTSHATGSEPVRGRSSTRHDHPLSPGEITDVSSATTYNGPNKGQGYDDPFSTYNSYSKTGASVWDNTVQTPAWGTPGHTLRHLATTPNPPVGGWISGFAQPVPNPQLDGGYDKSYGYAPTPSITGGAAGSASATQPDASKITSNEVYKSKSG